MFLRYVKSVLSSIACLTICLIYSPSALAKSVDIIATNFPQYDLASHILGDKGSVHMLLKIGAEAHSFEPTPKDLIAIENCSLFVFNGGENDEWIDSFLESSSKNINTFAFTKAVELTPEESKEGMAASDEDEGDSNEIEYDEHVWTSPVNVIKILQALCKKISEIDPENANYYQANTQKYIDEFVAIDATYKSIVQNATTKTLIFGDRFPLVYFVHAYSLDYYAAFKGCSNETEVSAATIKFLIDKAKKTHSKVIFKIELSSDLIASAIAEASDCKVLTFNTGHNLSIEQFKNHVSLADLFRSNFEPLKEALN